MDSMERQRLVNALLYFTLGVQYPGKTKLSKLLFHLDFEHYEKKGRSVTGLEYKAFREGPIPPQLILDQWSNPPSDLKAVFKFSSRSFGERERKELVPIVGVEFNPDYFTKLQIDIMKQLTDKYFAYTAADMSADSHKESGIWYQVWHQEGRPRGDIPYRYALLRKSSDDNLKLLDYAVDREAFLNSLNK